MGSAINIVEQDTHTSPQGKCERLHEDRYGRTVAELWIPVKPNYEGEIHLNTAMVEAGMAYHYQQYSGNCESAENLGWAEKIARDDKLGVWNGSHQKPWEFRLSRKKN
jgi:endonuclease YncB( thermonuclease family)